MPPTAPSQPANGALKWKSASSPSADGVILSIWSYGEVVIPTWFLSRIQFHV